MEQIVKEYIAEKNIPHEELHLHIEAIDQRFMASGARNAAERAGVELMKRAWNNELPEDGSRDHQRYTLNVVSQLVYEGGVDSPISAASQDFVGPSTGLQVTIANILMSNRPEMSNLSAVMLSKALEVGSIAVGLAVIPRLYEGLMQVVSNLGYAIVPATIAAIISVLLLRRAEPRHPRADETEAVEEISHYESVHENKNETREEFIMRHVYPVNEKVAGYEVWNMNMEMEGTTKKDTPNTVGWGSQSGNMWSRMVQVTGKFRGPYTFAGKKQYVTQGAVIAGESKPLERAETRFKCIRCMALKKDGRRCKNVISYDDALMGVFCGQHKNKANQRRVNAGEWAVDAGCEIASTLTGPASLKELASDENKLRF